MDVRLSETRDLAAARAFFRSACAVTGVVPDRVTTGSHPDKLACHGQIRSQAPVWLSADWLLAQSGPALELAAYGQAVREGLEDALAVGLAGAMAQTSC